MWKLAFTPRWLGGLLLALVFVTGFVALSSWQFNASTSQQVHSDPAKDRVRPYTEILQAHQPVTNLTVDTVVQAKGEYVPGSSMLVVGRLNNGDHGYWVLSEFIPEGTDKAAALGSTKPRAITVARAWIAGEDDHAPSIPAEPTGTVEIAGRVVNAQGAAPYTRTTEKVLESASPAQLTNLWDAPLYDGVLTLSAEVPENQKIPLTEQHTIAENATIIGQSENLRPIRAAQATNDANINWLNIFYSLEWLIFAAFALYLWGRMLKDAAHRAAEPAEYTQYFEYEGEYFVDEATGRPYYWDPADEQYYFFDEVPEEASARVEDTPRNAPESGNPQKPADTKD